MAQHVEPMDIDDIEGHFDNKENTYHHSNVQARTPCTEKGYEELDVSELNMKLRYSMTPAASPMSKSMSHCLDNRYNASTDESLNNTNFNNNENNLTRSLNSALNKTDSKSPKVLPFQVLPAELVDSNRNSTVLQPLDTTVKNDVTITVNNEIDNLSFPSSSSSMTQTPEATTPTKEVHKNDGGSPILRGLKSVLSMFRSSQSPIPPGEVENKVVEDTVLDPVDVPLPDSKPQAVASTPINRRSKERSLSRRNSPYKDSVVFNEDLEKELQWNDDSSIVFSTEKIPIHKLFFQDKPSTSKSQKLCAPEKEEDANSSVEYMDISYNDVSIRDRTLNSTINKSKVPDNAESDGEFVDCETTITQNESVFHSEETTKKIDDVTRVPEEDLVENVTVVNQQSLLYVTQDILNLIDSSQIVEEAGIGAKQLDFSTTDIVNQLSDLINASENTETNVINIDSSSVNSGKSESQKPIDGPKQTVVQAEVPEVLDNQVISPKNFSIFENNLKSSMVAENVSIDIVDKPEELSNVVFETVDNHVECVLSEVSSMPSEAVSQIAHEVLSQMPKEKEIQEDIISDEAHNVATHPLPVDIPLPSEDDFNSINDNFLEENQCADSKNKPIVETSISALMEALDETTTEETTNINVQVKTDNVNKNPCQPSLLSSDVSLPNTDDNQSKNNNDLPHEATTAVPDLALPQTSGTPDISSVDSAFICSSMDHIQVALLTKNAVYEDSNIKTKNGPTSDLMQPAEKKTLEETTELLPETLAMEVSTIEGAFSESNTNIENTVAHVEQSQEELMLLPLNIAPELPEVQTQIVAVDIVGDLLKAEEPNEKIVDSVTEPITDKDFIVHDASKLSMEPNNIVSIESKSENIPNSVDSKVFENIDPLLNTHMLDANNSSVFEMPPPVLNLSGTSSVEKKTSDLRDSTETVKESDNLAIENVGVTTTDVNVKSIPLPSEQSLDELIPTEKPIIEKTSEVIDEATEEDKSSGFQDNFCVINNLNTTNNVEKPSQLAENIDEEIVASESNSPFVSVSAEDAFDPETKGEYSENIENPISIKDQPHSPVSPKIISKGYNFNFDDIDSINPFTTKAKIRMSPPPDSSPNASLENVIEKKTKKVVPNQAPNANRRKSMPERKVPLRAKRNFNSTFDSTEKASTTQSPQKSGDHSSTPKMVADIKQVDSQIVADKVQTDIDAVTLPAQEVIHTLDATKLDADNEHEFKEDAKVTLDEVISKPDNASTIIEDDIFNGRQKSPVKSDNTSSSEQSTYFSAGTSSTECESKNVFNLPEIDDKDFNPFATKCKIRQTPSPELEMVNPFASKSKLKSSPEKSFIINHKDANATVNIESDDIKNLSNCSGSSKTSDEKDVTVQEVHTEDEDTIEGPFLEADDEGDNISEISDDKVDTVEINNINAQVNDDNTDAAEMFIDAEAFEFLMNQNKDDEVAYSGKESLFLKFDPLFARRVTSEGVAAALSEIKRKQSTPKKNSQPVLPKEYELLSFEKPVAGPLNVNVPHEEQSFINESREDMNATVSKPMMVVTPAVNPVVTPRHPSTPNRTNRLSMTFTSPAMAVIDRLLSLSGNSPSAGLDATAPHVTREHNGADQALTQLRELLAEKEINVYNLRCESKELKDRLTTLETQMKSLETESAERLKKINELSENLIEKTKMNKSMAAVVEEYERTIASLISETEQDKKRYAEERGQLIRERDEQSAHLASMEVSFNDLHSKYEKSKQVIMGYKSNEDAYKNSLKEFEENLAKMHTNYELLKQHATSKLNHANQELEKLNKAHEAEVLKFNAMIKRKDLHITSLEESLAQKTKANEELTAICDELINKVG